MKVIKLISTILFISLFLNACASHQAAPEINQYSLSTLNPHQKQINNSALKNKTILRIVPASIATQFSGKSFVYRESDSQYISDPYNQFLVAPNLQTTNVVSGYLTRSANALVTNSESLLLANYALQLNIQAFYADYRDKTHPTAITIIQANLYKISEGVTSLVSEKTFKQNQIITPNNPNDLIKAYDNNLEKIATKLSAFINTNL